MLNLAARLGSLPEGSRPAPRRGYEHVKGWGVFGLPFNSGHVLALRVFPESDFGAYRTIWHRDPEGNWSIHVDGPRLDTACPRYYGPACAYTGFSKIDLRWSGPASLHVSMETPALEWSFTASDTPALRALNTIGGWLPLGTWRPGPLLRVREWVGGRLGMGHLTLSGTMPSGHWGILMPARMYFVNEATASLDGIDLGRPVRVKPNPMIGEVPMPARGVLAIGQAMWAIRDQDEFERTRHEIV
jgi:hypothetical protein